MNDFEQMKLWDTPIFKIDKPIRLIELFAGIGSQAKALERLGADFEHYRVCEFDKYAVTSYNAIHGTNFTTSDVTKITADDLGIVDTDLFNYLLTYSFPCQSLSTAGKGEGMAKGSGTRSGLLWEVERLLNECTELPQVLLMENVINVHGKKNIEHFETWIRFLESKGYSNYWQDLNAKNYGIPQSRNRTFMVSVLGDYEYEFPKPFLLELRLKDMLEDEVDEKFYLSDKILKFFIENTKKQQEKGNGFKFEPTDGNVIAKAITTRAGGRMDDNFIEEPGVIQIGNCCPTKTRNNPNQGRIYDAKGISPCLNQMGGGNRQPFVVEEPVAYDEQNRNIRWDGTVGTLTTDGSSPKHNNRVIDTNRRIRKLTPKECFRLMGFTDADFENASQYNSNTQLYKQAGNSIVVDVLYYIFKQML